MQLKAGDWVEVRSEEEILATLDADGTLDNMPFMPEMLRFAGKRMQVVARADKTCDTATKTGGRRMLRTIHLDTRCDGSTHGGCQAACMLFWKEAWLKRVDQPTSRVAPQASTRGPCTRDRLQAVTRQSNDPGTGEVRYRCQATELVAATTLLKWWDIRQYWRDWRSGNVNLGRLLRVLAMATFNAVQRWRGGVPQPALPAMHLKKTPSEALGLQPGELIRVKSLDEIARTLDVDGKNRGMRFDVEMARYCGGQYPVRQRVERIIDEPTGRMLRFANECIILEGGVCKAECSQKRLFCPRSIYSYWREIWLERVDTNEAATEPASAAVTSQPASRLD